MPPDSDTATDLRRHVDRVLHLYRRHPHTTGRVRKADRLLAEKLHRQGVPANTIEAALLLVAARRSTAQTTTPSIRSLHYFLPAIRECVETPLDPAYAHYLRRAINYDTDRDLHQSM